MTNGVRRILGDGPPLEWGEPIAYLCDDRGEYDANEVVIEQGGNGDWYVRVQPAGFRSQTNCVRLCTSGGASAIAPGLTVAIAAAYRALWRACGGREP